MGFRVPGLGKRRSGGILDGINRMVRIEEDGMKGMGSRQ